MRSGDAHSDAPPILVTGCEDIAAWSSDSGADLSASNEHVTEGRASLRVRFTADGTADAVTSDIARDWTGARHLTFDAFVEATMPVLVGVRLRDGDARTLTRSVVLRPGANTVSVDLDQMEPGARQDRSRMDSLCLFQIWSQRATVWFDHLRATVTPASVHGTAATAALGYAPPPDFAGDFGPYRSPLLRDDGSRVTEPSQWPARRAEIQRYWHGQMGPWPALLDDPVVTTRGDEIRDGITYRRVTIGVAPGRSLDGYLLVPAGGAAKRPAVLTVFYEPESAVGMNADSTATFARDLAERGIVALSIGAQPCWSPEWLAFYPDGIQPLSFLAYVAANCCNALAAMPEVDPTRIGIAGHSYGGKWAMFASCLYDRFACAAWSDCGIVFDENRPNVNYWEPWYLGREPGPSQRARGVISDCNPRTGPYRTIVESGHDLHELHALMAPRPFLVSGGSEDPPERWRALNHAIAVSSLLGCADRVAMTNRPDHPPTPASNAELVEFFVRHLRMDER